MIQWRLMQRQLLTGDIQAMHAPASKPKQSRPILKDVVDAFAVQAVPIQWIGCVANESVRFGIVTVDASLVGAQPDPSQDHNVGL